jgi:predicted Co/Zn/Cd cation transporter (cation efflux family)
MVSKLRPDTFFHSLEPRVKYLALYADPLHVACLARILHELPTATVDMAIHEVCGLGWFLFSGDRG